MEKLRYAVMDKAPSVEQVCVCCDNFLHILIFHFWYTIIIITYNIYQSMKVERPFPTCTLANSENVTLIRQFTVSVSFSALLSNGRKNNSQFII